MVDERPARRLRRADHRRRLSRGLRRRAGRQRRACAPRCAARGERGCRWSPSAPGCSGSAPSLDGQPQCGVLPASGADDRRARRSATGRPTAMTTARWPPPGPRSARTSSTAPSASPPAAPAAAWRLPDGRTCGWATDRLLASYLHVHWAGLPAAAPRLLAAARAAQPAKGAQAARGARGAKAARGAEAVQTTGAARTAPLAARTNVTNGPLVTLEQHQSSDDHDVSPDLAPTGTLTHATPAAPTTLSTAAAPALPHSAADSVAAGMVTLIGAGPGGPDLITVRGWRALQAADVVVHDRLADPGLIRELRPRRTGHQRRQGPRHPAAQPGPDQPPAD